MVCAALSTDVPEEAGREPADEPPDEASPVVVAGVVAAPPEEDLVAVASESEDFVAVAVESESEAAAVVLLEVLVFSAEVLVEDFLVEVEVQVEVESLEVFKLLRSRAEPSTKEKSPLILALRLSPRASMPLAGCEGAAKAETARDTTAN
jgi:hypothetical protein